ncbi:Uncharacterized membrane protein [Flavobacterium fryxellicola]|uniref:DUF2254 domain-containing protein n=1 Tax=Flavobacterium fryxellicola TaxID=249352 RepID=A0A168AB11_9FLAO|nr:DUF2254 domain-containing protein [Flavobacterium fryxellicola]OAB31297.1 hypothetical protein FBFR_00195 [Flavobacterium fryxellicola]SHN55052.1 Uncharacterized membrane protein [Flavobacterium fryxellicola]
MKKILFFWNELKSSFWFIPIVIIIISVPIAIGFVYLDGTITIPYDGLQRFFFVSSADSARSILSTISGAMIGVAGTVFSVTLVALTLASSQFGPRLIKNFMAVRLNQVVLGTYVSTYLFCLLVLNAIKETDRFNFIPAISILMAIILAVVNIILLIVFIHQIAISIQADKVISDIHTFIASHIKNLFPEQLGDELDDEHSCQPNHIKSQYQTITVMKSLKSGYIQYIDSESLLDLMIVDDALMELYVKPGDYLVENIEIGKVYHSGNIDPNLLSKVQDQFIIGRTRTSQQDLEFSIHQMVEIAARALSPGVNDPYTAIACIDNLTAIMSSLAQVKFPSKYRFDTEKNLRVIAVTLNFEGVLNAAFNQIRQFSAGSPSVIIRLMEGLITINHFTKNESAKNAIKRHAKMIVNVGKQSIKEPNDLDDLLERSNKLVSE